MYTMAAMAQLQLRPLGVGEIIDATLTLYRRRFAPMVMVVLALTVIPFALTLIGGCADSESTPGVGACRNFVGGIGDFAFSVMVYISAVGAVLVAAGAYADIPPNWQGAARTALRRILSILAAGIVFGIVIGVGFILLIVPGIILMASLAWFDAALMIEKTGPMAALGRSWRLVSGERGRIVLAGLVFLLLQIVVFGVIGVILYFLISGPFGASAEYAAYLARQIVTWIAIPMTAAFTAVVYLDLRVRQEQLDKEGLAAQLTN